MGYREVTMIEVKEILRLWLAEVPKQRIARLVGVDRKTIQRYTELASKHGLRAGEEADALTDERLGAVLVALKSSAGRPHGESWRRCREQREFIEQKIQSVKLSKIRKLLLRRGVDIPTLPSTGSPSRSWATAAGRAPFRLPIPRNQPLHPLTSSLS